MTISKRTFHQLAVLAEVHRMTVEEYIATMVKYEFEDLDTYNCVSYDEYLNWKVENRMIPANDIVDI